MSSRILAGLKFAHQFGLRPLVQYACYRLGLRTGYFRWRTETGRRTSTSRSSPFVHRPLFALPARDQLLNTLGEAGKAALLAEAEEILSGKFRMFGGEPREMRLSLAAPLHHWTAYETRPELLAAVCAPDLDVKFLWEPARFGWAFVLGRAYHLTGENRFAEAFWRYFETFYAANPTGMGPHWMNGQEVAIRLIALVWAAHVFEQVPSNMQRRHDQLVECIHAHASRIPHTLIYARSQDNNHLLSEAASLYTAGLYFEKPSWRTLGWKSFHHAIRNQIGDYGEYIQHSTNYHRLMLHLALWVHFIKQEPFPAGTSQALARASHWIFSMLDNDSGKTPNLGSNDGALILPLSGGGFDDYRPTIQAAARAFLRNSLPQGLWDEMSVWLGLRSATRVTDSNAYLTDNLRARNSWGYLRASSFKSRLTHMDQLHFDLWWRGLNIAQDAGSYLYNADPPWDNVLVTTRVHNTVTVDGRDQMTRGGSFLVLDWANAFAKPIIESDERILHKIRSYYTGYRGTGIRHERTVAVDKQETWRIEDRLVSRHRTPHKYRLHWLLPDWEWTIEENSAGAVLKTKSPYGWVALSLNCSMDVGRHVSLVRTGELIYGQREVLPWEGWVSRKYGEKSPALSFAFEVTSPYHTVFISEFAFPK